MLSNGVKITFFSFPYQVPIDSQLKGFLKMPDLLTLAAMQAFARWDLTAQQTLPLH